jgi:hypothetical protein
MKVLYILKQDPDETFKKIMEVHENANDTDVFDIRKDKDYSRLVELIEDSEKIISW